MSKINKVLYNVDQRDSTKGEPTTADERRIARKNLGLDEVVGQNATSQESGIAPLDANGKVPAVHLPSYVDDIVDGYYYDGSFYEEAGHTTVILGETGKIYVDITSGGDNTSYRYDGTHFVQISAQNTYSKVAFKGSGASSATTIASTQVSDTFQFTSGEGINLSQVGSSKELKIDVDFGSGNSGKTVTVSSSGTATVSDLTYSSSTASGNTLAFIDSVSQSANGQISATKKNVTVDTVFDATGTNPVNGIAVSKALETLGVNDISGLSDALAAKQDTLTAGNNVRIDNNVISATDTTYTAGSGLQLNSTTFSVNTTTIQPKLTAGTNITIDSSNKISATKSDWNASAGAEGEILNKPVVIEGQIKLQGGPGGITKQFKNLTIDNSGFAGTPAAVSVTSTEDTPYTPGYLVTPAGSANKYLRSGTGGVPEWDILDMGTYEEYEDEETSVSKDLTKIYVENLYNGNERIKFNDESSYKYLVPPPSPNRQLVTNANGVIQWSNIHDDVVYHEIVLHGTPDPTNPHPESGIFAAILADRTAGKTPVLYAITPGYQSTPTKYDYYFMSAYSDGAWFKFESHLEHLSNHTTHTTITIDNDDYVGWSYTPLQTKLVNPPTNNNANSMIATDSNGNAGWKVIPDLDVENLGRDGYYTKQLDAGYNTIWLPTEGNRLIMAYLTTDNPTYIYLRTLSEETVHAIIILANNDEHGSGYCAPTTIYWNDEARNNRQVDINFSTGNTTVIIDVFIKRILVGDNYESIGRVTVRNAHEQITAT